MILIHNFHLINNKDPLKIMENIHIFAAKLKF